MELQSADAVPNKRPKPRLWNADDLISFEMMLKEHPVLEAPYPCPFNRARYRAALLRKQINARGNITVTQRVWRTEKGYRWAVILDD